MKNENSFLKNFFHDKNGKFVVWQNPNKLLWLWLFFKILTLINFFEEYHEIFARLSTSFFFVWAYLELVSGVNYFRRLFGLFIILCIAFNFSPIEAIANIF